MKERLKKMPGGKEALEKMRIGTFHALCSRLLSEQGRTPVLADEGYSIRLAQKAKEKFGFRRVRESSCGKYRCINAVCRGRNRQRPKIRLSRMPSGHRRPFGKRLPGIRTRCVRTA